MYLKHLMIMNWYRPLRPLGLLRLLRLVTLLLLAVALTPAHAQETGEKPDKNTIRRLLHWVSIFTMYSDVALSDQADLQEYSEVADLAAAIVTNPDLSIRLANFKGATYLNVYPKGMVDSEEWIFAKLNSISDAQYDVLNAPYLALGVWFTPVNNYTGYQVKLTLNTSPEVTQDFQTALAQANATLAGQTFAAPRAAKTVVNLAIDQLLTGVQQIVGYAYAPNLAIRFDDDLYLNGQVIETWQRTDTELMLEAVDREGNPVAGAVTWTNATGTGSRATVSANTVGSTSLQAAHGTDVIQVTLKIDEFTIDWRELLKTLLQEVITQLVEEGDQAITESIEKRKAAQQESQADQKRLNTLLEQQMASLPDFETIDITDDLVTNATDDKVLVTDLPDDERYHRFVESLLKLRQLFIEEQFKEVRKVMLAVLLTSDHFDKLLAVLEEDMAQVASELILKLAQGEGKDEIKSYLTQYLNTKLDAVIANELGDEVGTLYTMLESGAGKAAMKEYLSNIAAEKIVAAID